MVKKEIVLLTGIAGVLGGVILVQRRSYLLPYEPYPYATLPINTHFEQKTVEPFKLLSVFSVPGHRDQGQGRILFEDSIIQYDSFIWSWLATRTKGVQDVVNMKWIWKALSGDCFVCEAWNAHPNLIGHTAMLIFDHGEVTQAEYPHANWLMDFDPFADWVTVQMTVDYTVPEIRDLWINTHHFTHLKIGDEPIGQVEPSGFWQLQMYQPKYSSCLLHSIQAEIG